MKSFVKFLFMAASAMTVMLFPSCDKDDDGGSAGGFDVHVPSFVKGTTPIRVDLGVSCDKAPTVTFATEGDALGVVSPVENPEFDTITSMPASRSTRASWTAALRLRSGISPLHGNHAVTFTVNYTQNGAAKTGTNRKVLKVSDASNGGFYPEVVGEAAGYYFSFRNELEKFKRGCDFYVAFVSLNGKTDPKPFNILISQGKNNAVMAKDTFYSISGGKWDDGWQNWIDGDGMVIREGVSGEITLKLIFRDNYNRCRDVEVKTDANEEVISSIASDYYLWPRNK